MGRIGHGEKWDWNQKTKSFYARMYGINFDDYNYKASDDHADYTIFCNRNNHPQSRRVIIYDSKKGIIE